MRMTAVQRFDLWLRHATPVGLAVLLAILSVVPVGIPGYAVVVPAYTTMGAFYWAVFRPDLQPPIALFLVGVLQDVLAATPLGTTALCLMVVHGLAVSQRRAFLGKPFVLTWFGFVLIYALAATLIWCLVSVLSLQPIGPGPAVFQYLVTVTLFPVVAWVFVRVHRHVVR